MILKLLISHRDNLYLKYRSRPISDIFYRINCIANISQSPRKKSALDFEVSLTK
ncbi:hypothetical protein Hanom_Chr00s003607g01714001 [Helianthus anomalus]